jgi:hypothetical protein
MLAPNRRMRRERRKGLTSRYFCLWLDYLLRRERHRRALNASGAEGITQVFLLLPTERAGFGPGCLCHCGSIPTPVGVVAGFRYAECDNCRRIWVFDGKRWLLLLRILNGLLQGAAA